MITKKIYSKLLCLIIVLCVLFGVTLINLLSLNRSITAYADEITVNIDDDFDKDSVIVGLTKEATRRFLDYTVEDFKEINAIAVYDLTSETVGWVEKQVLGIPTQEKMLINVEKFRRVLKIQIPENTKENVLTAISILEQREDVEIASPNYICKTCSIANDSNRSLQWALNNIDINNAWDITTGANEIVVGVIDSGIDASHIDLTDNIHRKYRSDRTKFSIDEDITLTFYYGIKNRVLSSFPYYDIPVFDIYFKNEESEDKYYVKHVEENLVSKKYDINVTEEEWTFNHCEEFTIPKEVFIGESGTAGIYLYGKDESTYSPYLEIAGLFNYVIEDGIVALWSW